MSAAGMLPTMRVTISDDDDVELEGVPPGDLLALWFSDDLQDYSDECEKVLGAIGSIRAGRLERFECTYNATRIEIDAAGASLRFAAGMDPNEPQPVDTELLISLLLQLRTLLAARERKPEA